jgi:hypothetical protein
MYYEINVSKKRGAGWLNPNDYGHYFATAPRSLQSKKETKAMLKHFLEIFPEPEYKISVCKEIQEGIYYPNAKQFLESEDQE